MIKILKPQILDSYFYCVSYINFTFVIVDVAQYVQLEHLFPFGQ